jgi:general secretion pathway protein M
MQLVRERWRHLSQRERTIILAGGMVAVFSLAFMLFIDPFLDKLDRLERQAIRKQQDIKELSLLSRDYRLKRDLLAKAEGRLPTADSQFSLLRFMEEAATTANVREWITAMQPQVQMLTQGYQETAVDVRLEGIQLPELLALLVAIDQAPYDLLVRHFQVRPKFDNPVYLDANIRVLSYAKR